MFERKMIAVFLFLFCARFVNSQKLQSTNIQWATPDQSVNVNETVRLQCSVDNIGSKRLVWSKVGRNETQLSATTIASNEEVFLLTEDGANPKYEVSKDQGTFTLRINNVGDEDVGVYICSVPTYPQTISKTIRVTVRSPPYILENTTSSITARVNDTTKLECYVSGTPPLQVIWTREDGGTLPTGDRTYEGTMLKIDRVRKEYAGTYFCTARNEVKDVKKTFKLRVEFEPEIEVAKKRVGQALQNKVALECKTVAFPDPEIVWLKDGRAITAYEPHLQAIKSALPNAITISRLEITPVNRTQYGNYTCRAVNSLGRAEETIEFYETQDPQCYAACGSSFDYPDFKLIVTTTAMLVVLMIRW